MRDDAVYLRHIVECIRIDLELVWKVIENDLPELRIAVAKMLQNITSAEG